MNFTGIAIDTASRNSSISLLKDNFELDSVLFESKVSPSKDLIFLIKKILIKNKLELKDLDFISVCTGPGSFTGIRVGIAYARGIAKACGLKCLGVTKFEALAFGTKTVSNFKVLIEGSMGDIYLKKFSAGQLLREEGLEEYQIRKISDLRRSELQDSDVFVMQDSLFQKLFSKQIILVGDKTIIASDNISTLIGLKAGLTLKKGIVREDQNLVRPLYSPNFQK